jgi:glucosamine-6-phosphate deaminase
VYTRIFDTPSEAGLAVAARVIRAVSGNPALVLGLPAGRSPIEAYAELRRRCSLGEVDFSRASVFLVDEFVGVDASHPGSFRSWIGGHLLSGINLPPDRVHSLNGRAADLTEECGRYDAAIAASGGLDLLLLGIGANGHVGFNEPGESLVARTHPVRLLDATRRDNAGLFGGDQARVPTDALSMGMGTILGAGTILLLATGGAKRDAVSGMLRGPVTTRVPASFLQLHPCVEIYLDRSAAAGL